MPPDLNAQSVTPRTRGIKAFIAEAARDLVASRRQGRAEDESRLLFFGNWQDAHPRALLYDPALTSDDKIAWLIMKASADPKAPTSMPDYAHFMQAGLGSRPTVAKSKTMLRITRWISLCHRVRDHQGRFRGNVYALHDEPVPLADTIFLDEGYIDFLHGCLRHRSTQVRDTANAVLETIRERMEAGEDVSRDRELHLRASDRITALRRQRSRFFSTICKPANRVQQVNSAHQVNELNAVEIDRVNLVNADPNALIEKRVNEVNSCSSCSSNNNKTTTTTDLSHGAARASGTAQPPANRKSRSQLHWPDSMSETERRLAAAVLGDIPDDEVQQILDELVGSGNAVQDRLRWLAGVTRRWRKGEFMQSSRGLAVAETRERNRRTLQRQQAEEQAAKDRLEQQARKMADAPLPTGRLGQALGRLLDRVQQAGESDSPESRRGGDSVTPPESASSLDKHTG